MQGTRIGAAFALMAGAGALLGGAGLAEAAPPSFNLTNDGTTPATSSSVTFNQFDPSLGTLTAVNVNLTDPATAGAAQVTITGGEGTATAQLLGSLQLTGPGAQVVFSGGTTVTATCDTGSSISCGGTGTQVNPVWPPVPVTITTNLAAYTGSGTFDLTAAIASVTVNDFIIPRGISSSQIPTYTHTLTWSGNLSVTFDYVPITAVPEPASLAMLGISLGGLWGARRRRHR